jgi:hypothetical protein
MKQYRAPLVLAALTTAGMLAAAPAVAAPTPSDLPPVMTQGSVKYMSGGIGTDEEKAIRGEMSKYPLTLEFAEHAKPIPDHLAGINVTIKDQSGKTELDTISDGPFMLVQLPAGKYRITADENGKAQTRDVVVAANTPEHVLFEW